jgi:hypothetical protein
LTPCSEIQKKKEEGDILQDKILDTTVANGVKQRKCNGRKNFLK